MVQALLAQRVTRHSVMVAVEGGHSASPQIELRLVAARHLSTSALAAAGEGRRRVRFAVIERDGRRVLQQWRNKPGGMAYEFTWVDVLELPKPASVSPLSAAKRVPPTDLG